MGQMEKHFKGTSEASTPVTAWRQAAFDDGAWSSGGLPIGYGETFITTTLADMIFYQKRAPTSAADVFFYKKITRAALFSTT